MAKNTKVDKDQGGGVPDKRAAEMIDEVYAAFPNDAKARRSMVMEVLTRRHHKMSERPADHPSQAFYASRKAAASTPAPSISKSKPPSKGKTAKQPARKR